jgi:metal transporter CNNM
VPKTEVAITIDDKLGEKAVNKLPSLRRWKSYPNTQNSNTGSRRGKWSKDQSDVLQVHEEPLPTLSEDEEAVGIITMEDVIEELLQVSFCEVLIFFIFSKFENIAMYLHL